MATTLKTKNSVTTTVVPTTLAQGELAVNITDKKLWVGNAATTPVLISDYSGSIIGGSNTQVQYNSSGAFAGSANFTFNGTTLTLANDASISGLTVGKGGGSQSTSTAVGYQSLNASNSGSGEVGLGYQSLYSNTTGNYNIGIGYQALYTNTTGGSNIAIGNAALKLNTTASYNTAVGDSTLSANTTGTGNSAFGQAGLYLTTTGSYNSAVGQGALQNNTTASNNTAVGYQALYSNTTSTSNTAVGYQALYYNTQYYNTAVGYQAGLNNTTGDVTAFGMSALKANTTGVANVAVGGYSGNVGVYGALQSNTTGSYNIAVGTGALQANTTASNNTALGYQAGYQITTGGNNICIGYQSGYGAVGVTTGTGNTLIGYGASPDAAADTNELVILAGTNTTPKGKGSNTGFIFVNNGSAFGGIYQGNNSASWTTTSDRRLKKNIVDNTNGLDIISQIKVRNFEYRLPEEVDAELKPSDAICKSGIQLGVIAQELQEILPECVKQESSGVLSVDSDNLTWYLINAVKQLKAEIDELKGAK